MKLLLTCSTLLLCFVITAQPRFTDSTFGTNGKVVENTSAPGINLIDALLQPDGKTLTLTTSAYNTTNRPVLIRYNTDGTADASFSGDGVADSMIVSTSECTPRAMRLQPDGKILVCGDTGNYYSISSKAIAMRYNADGSLDASFGTAGLVYLPTLTLNGNSFNLPYGNNITVLSSGKIMLLCTRSSTSTSFILIRLNSNGAIDSTFGSNGISLINPLGLSPGGSPTYTHLEVQTDGKYIIGGSFNTYDYLLVRANANGTLDNSYGAGGTRLLSGAGIGSGLTDMILQPDNKIVVCGPQDSYAPHTYTAVLRLTAAGSLDAGFGTGGKQLIYTSATGFTTLKPQLGLQTDGKILIGGMAKSSSGSYTMAVARLTTTGQPDVSFDGDGTALIQGNGYNSYGYVPRQQSDGKIVVAGYIRRSEIQAATIGRLTATGQPDATLNVVAAATLLNNGPGDESGLNLLVQPADQKIISVRERSNGFNYDLCVSRHLPSGLPDASFGTNGKTYLDIPGDYYEVYSGLSADGKITVVPDFADYATFGALAMYRLQANGQPDSGFGQNGKRFFKSRNADTVVNALLFAVVQPDGKTVMTVQQSEGYPDPDYSRDSSFLIRLNSDGSFDNSFNGNGKKFIPGGYGIVLIQPNGKIIVSRSDTSGTGYGFSSFIRRLNVDGSVDATFNNGVEKEIDDQATHGTLQPDGKIVLLTYSYSLVRLTSSGVIDSTFGTNGTADVSNYYPDNGNGSTYISNLRADSGHLVIAGRLYDFNADGYVFKIVALKNNGLADSSFGQSGMVISDFFANGHAEQIALQTDKKILITGFTESPVNPNLSDFALTRLKSGPLTTGRLYTFTGSGLWSNPTNWSEGTVPPATIPAGSSVVIDPPAGSECVIDVTVHVQAGASVTVKAGKQVRLPGNLILQ